MDASNSVAIRRAHLDDASALAQLGAATFTETFGYLYPPADLNAFLASTHSASAWQKTLSDRERAVWAAELQTGKPIGFIVVGTCKLPVENREPTAGEIQQLYVKAEHHNLRLGTKLMELGMQWLQEQGKTPVYIGVWSENYGAQRFYGRYGFSKCGEYGFKVGNTVDHEFILKR